MEHENGKCKKNVKPTKTKTINEHELKRGKHILTIKKIQNRTKASNETIVNNERNATWQIILKMHLNKRKFKIGTQRSIYTPK